MDRLLCGVAEQLAEGRNSKPGLLSRGFDSSMYALGHKCELVGSAKKRWRRGTEACTGCSRSDAVKCGACGWQNCDGACSEQVWLVRLGSAPSRGCIATGKVRDQQAWPLVSCVLALAARSREEHCTEVQCLLHVVQGCRTCATCAATDRRPLLSCRCSGHRWRGKRTHSLEMLSEERQGR